MKVKPHFWLVIMAMCLAVACQKKERSKAVEPIPTVGSENQAPVVAASLVRESMATTFSGLGIPTGGCGVPEAQLDSPFFVALNVQNTPGDYASSLPRPNSDSKTVGEFSNGLNCGRWVEVTLSDYCGSGGNSGTPGEEFCQGGGWVKDQFSGAKLNMIVADSCQDGNRWCRDDRFHLDLATHSLGEFIGDGKKVSGLTDRWNNRRISWRYVPAPDYQGDVQLGFRNDAGPYWPAIMVNHLENGIHGVEYQTPTGWQKSKMVADNGQVYLLGVTQQNEYSIRIIDANDKLVGNGRIYRFSLPAICQPVCPRNTAFTKVDYEILSSDSAL